MALVGPVSWFATFEAKVIIKTSLSFFRGKFLNSDGVNIHGFWVSFLLGMVVVASVVLEGEEWVASSLGDFVGSFPNLLEVEGLLVPFFHGGWNSVHGVDSSHELGGDSSGKEVDQNILISNSTKGSIVLEFGNIVKDVNLVVDFGGGQPCYGLFSGIFEDK